MGHVDFAARVAKASLILSVFRWSQDCAILKRRIINWAVVSMAALSALALWRVLPAL